MKLKTLIWAVAILAAILATAWGVHTGARVLLYRLEPCGKPCRWVKGKGYADCSPVTVGLEVKATPRPTGKGEEVWYRATITNNSCEILSLAPKFLESNSDYSVSINNKLGTYLVAYDSAGHALPVHNESSFSSPADAEKKIHPYNYDWSAHVPFGTKLFDESYLTLSPGQSIATSPSILAPYRKKFIDMSMPGMMGTALAPEPIVMPDAAKHYAVPPSGFRRMAEYEITRSGIYTAEIIVNEQVWARLRYRYESYPRWLRQALWFCAIGKPSAGSFIPELPVMKAKSNLARFEVR